MPTSEQPGHSSDGSASSAAVEQYRRLAASYDQTTAWLAPYRRRAVELLRLSPGEVVLDTGCGTGVSFPLLEAGIGPEGHLVGVDLSPDMLTRARERVEATGWRNVTLVESSAEQASLPVQVDAVLFAFTHDVLRSRAALVNVLGHVKSGGRVAAAGPKWSPFPPLNLAVWEVARRFVTTFEGFVQPWSELARLVPNLQVEPAHFGCIYLAWGTVPGAGQHRA